MQALDRKLVFAEGSYATKLKNQRERYAKMVDEMNGWDKVRLSERDSNGNRLSKAQLEHFKESMVSKLNAEILKIRFGKGKYDAERLAQLEAKAKEMAKLISKNDKKLLSLEATGLFAAYEARQ